MTPSLDQMIAFMNGVLENVPEWDAKESYAILSRLQQLREARGALLAVADHYKEMAGDKPWNKLWLGYAAQLRALVETEGE